MPTPKAVRYSMSTSLSTLEISAEINRAEITVLMRKLKPYPVWLT